MNVAVTELGPCKKLLRVEIPTEEVEKAFQKVEAGFRAQVSLPGFRKGKAPKAMIQQRYGKDIEEEAKRDLLNSSYQKALQQEKVRPVVTPELEITQFGRLMTFQYSLNVEFEPEISLPEYKGLKVEAYRRSVTDDDVESVLTSMREKKSTYSDTDGAVETGHIAVINYAGRADGQPISEVSEASSGFAERKDYWVTVKPDSFLPGFTEELVGMKAGESKTVTTTFPETFPDGKLAGKAAEFDVELVGVKVRKLPEIDDAFAKEQGVDDVEALNKAVRESLENELKQARSEQIRNNLLSQLMRGMDFPVPDSILEQETNQIVYEMVYKEQQAGASEEQIESRKDEIYAHANNVAKQRVRSRFLLARIAKEEEVKVSEQELTQMVGSMAMRDGAQDFKAYVQKLKDENRIPDIAEDVRLRKTLDLLELAAEIEEVAPPEPEEAKPEA